MDSLVYATAGRAARRASRAPSSRSPGFASLHCAITLLVALMVQYTIRSRVLHWIFWVNFVITVVATLYFGWHYVADDVAGILIALISFYVGGIASGQKFDRHGLSSHPTTTTSPSPSTTTEPLAPDSPRRSRRFARPRAHSSWTIPYRELQPCSSSSRHAGDW